MTSWSMTPGNWQYVFRSGLRMQVTPEGDCREATFMAQGSGVGLRPLDAVQISFDGTPIFYGEVRVGGNLYDVDGHQFTLRSLALRLKEVTIPEGWSAPQQSATTTVRSLIEAVLPQLGGTVGIGQISLPFDCRAIKNAHQQNPYALLEQIAEDGAGLGVRVRFGVDAYKRFFCVAAREDVAALANDMLTAQTRWTAPVAETPCTAVLWYIAKKSDGNWLTHLSVAPEASVYGRRVKALSVPNNMQEGLWEVAPMTLSASGAATTSALVNVDSPAVTYSQNIQDAVPQLTNTIETFNPAALGIVGDANADEVAVYASANAQRITILGKYLFQNVDSNSKYTEKQTHVSVFNDGELLGLAANMGKFTYVGQVNNLKLALSNVDRPAADYSTTLSLETLRPERLRTDVLDRMAKHHYNSPATAPADIELRGFYSGRAGYVTLNGWQSPVDAWEYRLTTARGMCTGVLAGQPDDPTKLAQAELIKARDGRAVITALTSAT